MGETIPQVFFDADALIAGVHSATGAAGALLTAVALRQIVGIVSPQVLVESERNIRRKLPSSLPQLLRIVADLPFTIAPQPRRDSLKTYGQFADRKDAAIVWSAQRASATYLVSFNLRHYAAVAIFATFALQVMSPGACLKQLRADGRVRV